MNFVHRLTLFPWGTVSYVVINGRDPQLSFIKADPVPRCELRCSTEVKGRALIQLLQSPYIYVRIIQVLLNNPRTSSQSVHNSCMFNTLNLQVNPVKFSLVLYNCTSFVVIFWGDLTFQSSASCVTVGRNSK